MIRPARLLAGLAIFAFFVVAAGRAADAEFASAGGTLSNMKGGVAHAPGRAVFGTSSGHHVVRGQASGNEREPRGEVGYGAADRDLSSPGGIVACGASSIGPDGRVTVTSCEGRLSERAEQPGDLDAEMGQYTARSESLYQGKPIRWWARRAVQARKDANARGRTIRRLQALARRQLVYPTGHWLDGAFLCIHRYERGAGGWQTATGNGYRGGLQFDSSFARTYGPSWAFRAFGGVERWPASVQIAAAVQAWTTRSFGPWPSTRRMCGL